MAGAGKALFLRRALALAALAALGCAPSAPRTAAGRGVGNRPERPARPAAGSSEPAEPAVVWQAHSRSPQRAAAVSEPDAPLYAHCGEPDLGLERVAGELVARRLGSEPPPGPRELEGLLRANGVPQIWPAAWSLGGIADEHEIERRLASWVQSAPPPTLGRCGVARALGADGRPVVAAVRVDALAELEPLPTRARLGQWLALDATLNAPATAVQVIVLGPRGRPRSVPSSFAAGRASARFSLDQPGGWLVQLVASLPSGPLPVLEARVFVEMVPPTTLGEESAPGQDERGDDAAALWRMLNAARASERLPPLERDPELDRLAEEHARAMAERGELGHEVGQGAPDQRVSAAGLGRGAVGENVASAATLARAHGSLWASPSHRENLLGTSYHRVGLGVTSDGHGMRWVAELFTD